MVDNTILPGTGEKYAAKDRGGVKFQEVLIGSDTKDPLFDAFGRMRISELFTIFDSKLITADKQDLFWDESLETGSGITASNPTVFKPYIDIVSTLNTAGKFTRQTYRRFNYQPGKSQLIALTGVLDLSGGGVGVQSRIGLFDDGNGAFFEHAETGGKVVVRTSDSGTPVDTEVLQASWNIDVMNGSNSTANPSGISLDLSKSQIFIIDFQWLSVGRIKFGFDIGGTIHYVHSFDKSNQDTIPWASTPNLPVRYQLITTSSSPASSMRCICASVSSEGGKDPHGLTHSHATVNHVNANTADTVYALLGVRLQSNKLGCSIEPASVSILSELNDDFEWQLIHNPTVAGAFAYTPKPNSCVEVATGDSIGSPSVNTVTGGTIIDRGFGTNQASPQLILRSTLGLGAAIDGTRDFFVLAVRPLGPNADIQGSFVWREL